MNLKIIKATNIVKNVIGKFHKEELRTLLNTNLLVLLYTRVQTSIIKAMCIRDWKIFKNSKFTNEGFTAQKSYAEVNAFFKDEKVCLKNVIGFATDGCNTMMGYV
ncbi:E3 SUMO-protein ligase KIAA1586-like [Aphis craccivora]|uniref:E3 SUMO-protein ligase KIAA1586-like n=1 Tax=Aphis craccivora TaxID=307492 RepID=A0A6G0Y7N6_APHCR|nr:E3 SUMO-protein ligase KIAA1586-like [Aphis craccivora]